jgi:type IV pilus assembly protein PilM
MARATRRTRTSTKRTTSRPGKRSANRSSKKLGKGRRIATGIDVGSFSVKIVTLYGDDSGNIDIKRITVNPLSAPDGAEYQEELHERQKEALKNAVKKHGKLEGRVILGFPRSLVTIRYLNLPSSNYDELKEMVIYDVERHVPFAINELEISFQIIEKLGDHESRIMMVCVPRKEIQPYLDMCAEIGIEADRIEIDVLGDATAYSKSIQPEETVAIVNFGRSTVNLSIVRDDKLLFSRSMPISEEKLLSGFPGAKSWRDLHGRITAAGALHPNERDHFAGWVDRLSLELLRSISSFACDNNATKIERLILCGGAGYFPAGPPQGLSLRIKTTASVEPALNGELPSGDDYHGSEIATSAGLALRGLMKDETVLNLLPDDFMQEREQVNKSAFRKNIAILLFMILTLLGGAGYLYWYERHIQLTQLETFFQERLSKVSGLNSKKKELSVVEHYLDQKQSCINVIQGVLKSLPPKAYISTLAFTKRRSLEINGQVETEKDFEVFIEALNFLGSENGEKSFFIDIKPDTGIKQLPLGRNINKKIIQFGITCTLRWEEEKR